MANYNIKVYYPDGTKVDLDSVKTVTEARKAVHGLYNLLVNDFFRERKDLSGVTHEIHEKYAVSKPFESFVSEKTLFLYYESLSFQGLCQFLVVAWQGVRK